MNHYIQKKNASKKMAHFFVYFDLKRIFAA